MTSEIDEAVIEYLRLTYSSPKQLCKEIYPLFQSRYAKRDFPRLIRRSLERLVESGLIVKHPLRPYYCIRDNERFQSFVLESFLVRGLRHGKLALESDMDILNATPLPNEKEKYSFAEYFMKERKKGSE